MSSAGDWASAVAPSGRTYYYNSVSGETTYDRPEVMGPEPANAGGSAADWATATAPDGRTYYYNTVTNETTYDMPAALKGASGGGSAGECVFVSRWLCCWG